MGFALLGCGSSCRDSSSVHQLLVGGYSSQHIRLGIELAEGPCSFCEGAGPNPNFGMMDIWVAQLAPEADLSSKDVFFIGVALYQSSDILIVEVEPRLIISIGNSQIIADAHIQIKRSVLGDDYFVFCGWEVISPPMNDVPVLNFYFIEVHPIHELFIWIQLFQHFMLFSAIMELYLKLLDFFLLEELGFILQAGQNDLVASQMNDRVREDVKHFSEYFLDQLVGLVERDIKRTHKGISTESACNSFVLWSQPPTGCVTGRIKLRYDSNSPPQAVLDDLSGLLDCVCLFR